MKRLLLIVSLVVAAIGMSVGVVEAAPGPTGDQGLVGACNMLNTHALPGMINAITIDNPNGFAGMGNAALLTSGSASC